MSEDKQVEAWRAEFESLNGAQAKFPNGEYCYPVDQYRWQGFLMAKRSMKPIELPKKCESLVFQSTFNADDIELAITAAGYSYRVNELWISEQ